MPAYVPSFEASLYLTDTLSIIGYTLRKYFRTPKNAVPILDNLIISLPSRVAEFGREPDTLVSSMQGDLQNTFDRIFNGERQIRVSVVHTDTGNGGYDVTISVMYTLSSGELDQVGVTLPIDRFGRIQIPEDTIGYKKMAQASF